MAKPRNKVCRKTGAGTLEYTIFITGVVSVVIIFAGPSGIMHNAINSTYTGVSIGMTEMAASFQQSRQASLHLLTPPDETPPFLTGGPEITEDPGPHMLAGPQGNLM